MKEEKKLRRDSLIYGKRYHLWRKGTYLGIVTFVNDRNIGKAFVKDIVEDGIEMKEVYFGDEWEFA